MHTTLLLIEDDPAVAQSLQDALKREGYAIIWKTSDQDGMRTAKEHNPHLILLDVH